ncbi:MAG TPA: Crp/Fnr family transcriptional regulator [Sediminibacterium sp.]|nr:Crp/Fnr family transcriptional regulator [Sediminibacterium sp.]
MQQINKVIRQMIEISDEELEEFTALCACKEYKKHAVLSRPGSVPQEIFFINKGLIRVIVTDPKGTDHSLHFAMENQFIADYAAFILQQPSFYTLQTEEDTEAVVIPRATVDWGYKNLKQGEKLGRLIAEFYFIYQDNRLNNLYARTPKERYDRITDVFPDIHNRVPQHMIASYLGITPVHLSRLKKTRR